MAEALEYDSLIRAFVDDPKFVAREWLTSEVLASLADPKKNFVLLTAESGAGKTGLSASLAHAHPDWLRYFIRRDSRTPLSSGDAVSFLFSIGNELAMRRPRLFRPDKLEVVVKQRISELLPGARAVGLEVDDLHVSPFYRTAIEVDQEVGVAGGDLEAVVVKRMVAEKRFIEIDNLQYLALLDPAAVLEREEPAASIVIIVDALDEIRPSPEHRSLLDWLATCPKLPANVKFVLTSRNDADLRLFRAAKSDAIQELTIDLQRQEVQTDIETYLESFTSEPQANRALARSSIEPRTFIREARRKARGNFGYISTLTRGILEAESRGNNELVSQLLRLEQVPEQLTNLYEFFLSLLRDRVMKLGLLEVRHPASAADVGVPAWEGVAGRVLGVLSVAREPLNLEQIARLGGVRVWPRELGNVLSQMLEFLDAEDGRYRLFHTSFAEYLTSPATGRAAPDYYFEPVEWHSRIVRSYKGEAAGWADVNWAAMDDYGLTHLGDHLLGCDAEMRRELSDIVQPSARTAMLNRFLTDAVFLRTVTLATREVLSSTDWAAAMSRLVYLASVKALLSAIGDRMTPPVLGLLTRTGSIATALGYVDTMNATVNRYHGLKAIRANASAADLERAAEMASVERLEAFAFELPESSYRYAFHSDRPAIVFDFARLIAPTDLKRALELAARVSGGEDDSYARDSILRGAALAKDDPDEALKLLQSIKGDVAEAALDCAERLLPAAGDRCLPVLAFAEAGIDFSAPSRTTAALAGRLIRAWVAVDRGHASELWARMLPALQGAASGSQPLAGEESYNRLWVFTSIARNLWDFDPDGIRSLLRTAFDDPPGTLETHSFLEAADVYAEKSAHAEARSLIERALAVSRTHAPYSAARDLARAAETLRPSDPEAARSLMDEAFHLLDNEQDPVPARNDGTYSKMSEILMGWDLDSALRAARRIEGLHWQPFEGDDYGDDRTSALVRIAMAQLESNPALASSLLNECLEALTRVEAVEASEGPSYKMGIDLDASELKGQPVHSVVLQITYYANALNHGMERRAWRVFETPIELLYDLLAPPRLNGSPYYVGRTLRRFAEAAAAAEAPHVAAKLCESIADEAEVGIVCAAIFDATAMHDWDQAATFAEGAISRVEALDSDAGSSLTDQFEILRWTNRKIRSLMEIAMHLGRYHPPSMTQIMNRINSPSMMVYLSCEMISRTIEEESEGRLKAGTPLEEEIKLHLNMMSLLAVPNHATPTWIMAGHVLRILARLDLARAAAQVSRFPVDALGALLRIRVASGVTTLHGTQALAWVREAVESLDADASPSHRVSVLGRAAAVVAQLDPARARAWAAEAVELARNISSPLLRGYAFLDLLRQQALHSIVGLQTLVEEAEGCLYGADSDDIQAELTMRAFPVLIETAPQRALRLFSAVAGRHWITLLAMLDQGAEALAKVCGPENLPGLGAAIDAAMSYLPRAHTTQSIPE